MADQIVRTVDYDYGQLDIDTNLILNVALRAKKLDQVASDFLARHPDAIGLDLGAGLDTRAVRLAPPSTVDWYDVDFPAVAAARRAPAPRAPQRARHRRRRHREGLAGRHPHRPAGRDRRRWPDGVPHPGRAGVAVEPAHQPLPQRRDRLQQLHPLRHLGGQARPRHQVRRRPRQVSRHGRPPRTRRLEPQAAAGQGDPAQPGARGRPSFHRAGASTTGWQRTAPPGPGPEPSSCTTASERPRSQRTGASAQLLPHPHPRPPRPGLVRLVRQPHRCPGR